ncbi:MAG: gliding motility-associated C-terminal domain-containing protein [Bacteroidota bacterium]
MKIILPFKFHHTPLLNPPQRGGLSRSTPSPSGRAGVGCVVFIVYCLLSISSSAQFTIIPTFTDVTCPGGSNGSASVSVSGGTSPYTYLWSDGNTTFQAANLTAQIYTVTITDNTGIDSTIMIIVSQPSPIADNADIQAPFCTSNGHIILLPTGGTSPYQFAWGAGQTVAGITSIGAGDYSVVVTDANNCTASFSYSFAETGCFVTPASCFTPNGDGFNDTWFIANSQYFDNARVIVFDRWGTRVYQHKGLYEPWDGKSYLGIPVPDAVYYYFFYQEKDDKQKNAVTGSVTILR